MTNSNCVVLRYLAQRPEELPGLGERGRPLPRHLDGKLGQHETGFQSVLRWTQQGNSFLFALIFLSMTIFFTF